MREEDRRHKDLYTLIDLCMPCLNCGMSQPCHQQLVFSYSVLSTSCGVYAAVNSLLMTTLLSGIMLRSADSSVEATVAESAVSPILLNVMVIVDRPQRVEEK